MPRDIKQLRARNTLGWTFRRGTVCTLGRIAAGVNMSISGVCQKQRQWLGPSLKELVTCSLHSDDQFWARGILLEFLAKTVHMRIHGSR